MPQSNDNDLTSKAKESDMAESKCNLVYSYYLLAMIAGCVVRHNRSQSLAQQEECFSCMLLLLWAVCVPLLAGWLM